MPPTHRILLAAFTLALLTAPPRPALALFDVKDPLSKMYSVESQAVIAGTTGTLNPDNHVLSVTPATLYKGAAIPEGELLQIQLNAPESLRQQVKPGQPIVIFKGARSVVIHLADHWYSAQTLAKPNQFRINGLLGDITRDETFPGKTADLVQALDEIKAGKSTLLDAFPDNLKFPPLEKIATLPPNATAFAACDLPGQDRPVFFIATPAGLQALALNKDNTLKDLTTDLGLGGLKPTRLAAATPSPTNAILLIDQSFHVFSDTRDSKSTVKATLKFPPDPILAAALPSTPPGLVFLTPKGLHLAELSPQSPDAQLALSDSDTRLTGTKLTDYFPADAKGFSAASLVSVDINADGRPDLILATDHGTLTLLNRGFGCYLVNKDFAAPLLDPAKSGKPSLPLLASTPPSTLWLLQPDGTLYRCTFPPK